MYALLFMEIPIYIFFLFRIYQLPFKFNNVLVGMPLILYHEYINCTLKGRHKHCMKVGDWF